jgi:hypothetical protein
MKSKSLFIAAMVFLIPALAFAGQRNSANVQLDHPVQVAGTQLGPGNYKMIWQGNGPDVSVSFIQGKKIVITAFAKLVSDPASQPGAIETRTATDKTVILHAVELENESIQFENAISAAGN